ncbi:MAG TPA: LytTR family DNA-binding domain-containing protein [Pyrinomonadaceae bacterium]|nr:LytTR family DNA-binding domain-containing protein [Pyrinomonadaceae bacterium]
MKKIRTLIVDDEPIAREGIRMLLCEDPEIIIGGECSNGREAIEEIVMQMPELVFLDVQMPEISGFDVLDAVGADAMPFVIFVTAYDKYALRAFEVDALDYLLKPFTRERFFTALERAKTQIRRHVTDYHDSLQALIERLEPSRHLERVVIKRGGRISFLDVDEIDWVEADDIYVRFHVVRESHLVRGTMNRLEARLDPQTFLRIHRSIIVNLSRVKELQSLFRGEYVVKLRDGTELTSSRSYRDKLQPLLENLF